MSDHRSSAPSAARSWHRPLAGLGLFACLMLGSTAMQAATPKTALVMAWNIDAISTFDPAQMQTGNVTWISPITANGNGSDILLEGRPCRPPDPQPEAHAHRQLLQAV
jgi:hypothetical protein